jgi:predicted ferric reductase
MRLIIRGIFWFGLYTALILFPLAVGAVFIDPAESASFVVDLAAALGYIGLALMAAELALVSRSDGAAGAFGEDALLQFHREIGIVALVFVCLHPALLVISRLYTFDLLVPWRMPWPVWMGSAALLAALLIVGLSLLRRTLRSPYELWQATHGVIAMVLMATAVAHILAVGRFSAVPAMRALWAVYLVAFIGMFLRYRLVRPLRLWRRPWEVVDNRTERGRAQTVTLRPVGHHGFTFRPGQFGWVGFGRTPFAMTQHPISLSSNAELPQSSGDISFTIKDLGDWSGEVVPNVKPGARAWVDAPHGVFTIDREEGAGYGLIGGGVGITPLRSMVLSLQERGDVRPVVLFYGARDEDDLTFDEELTALDAQLPNLTVVRVLSQPSEGWTGERGYITADVLRRHLPERLLAHFQYFICGPGVLMDAMEAVLPALGVPVDRVHTERFEMV